MNYDFDLDIHYLKFDNFKQKQLYMLRHILESGRLGTYMKFLSHATISFADDDTHRIHPHIEETETFNRIRTNCLVYEMPENSINKGYFNKCFIYQDVGAKGNGWYGYIMLNENTGKINHVYYIDREDDALCRRLNRTIISFNSLDKYKPYTL